MKKIVEHQSISPYLASNRPSYCTTFTHPIKKKRLNRSLGTTDPTEAKEICVHLERIVNNAKLWNIKRRRLHSLHPRAVEIFFDGQKLPPLKSTVAIPGTEFAFFDPATGRREHHADTIESDELANALQANVKLQGKFDGMARENESLKSEIASLRRAANKHVTATIDEAVAKWQKLYPTGRSPHTVTEAFASVKSFLEHVRPKTLLGTVKAGHVDAWVNDYRNPKTAAEVSAVTKRRVRAYVSSFFSWVVREYDLIENPMSKTGAVPGLARNPEQIQAIRRYDELIVLLDALKPWPYWRAWVAVACLAGPRWSEQVHLKAADVYMDSDYLRITSRASGRHARVVGTKTGRERTVPIEQKVLAPILKEYLATHDGTHPWLFPTTVNELKRKHALPGQWSSSGTFSSAVEPVLELAREKVKGKEDFWSFGPAEWRHCCGTALGHSGFNALEISRILGNSPDIAERHYIAALPIGKRWPLKWRR